MQQVTCPQCNSSVEITPDDPLCRVCQVDLRTLLEPVATTRYFYERARNLASRGEVEQALAEVNRGLEYEDDSDLRLLGAILAQRAGDYDQMRSHVAAIPVDDALRAEGEWLVRSHQERQLAEQMGQRVVGSASGSLARRDRGGGQSVRGRWSGWPVWIGLAVVAVLLFLLFRMLVTPNVPAADEVADAPGIAAPSSAPEDGALENGAATGVDSAQDAELAADETVGNTGGTDDDGESAGTEDDGGEGGGENPAGAADAASTPVPTPTPVVDFDLTDFLMARGYTGLAALDVRGDLEDGVLAIDGRVPTAEERDLLLEVIQLVPGLSEVNTDNFRLEPPRSYVVQSGDTLWSISYFIYGDTKYMDDIYRLNRDTLPSAEVLVVGMELELPRIADEE